MRLAFWTGRFLLVFTGMLTLIFVAGVVRGRDPVGVLREGAPWSALAAGLFVATRIYHLSRGRRCSLCKDAQDERSGAGSWFTGA